MSQDIDKLKKSKHFCAAPWTHLHVLPTGAIQPCCIWDYSVHRRDPTRFGNVNDSNNIPDLMNSEEFKKLRANFLNDIPEDGCSRCYDREKTSQNPSQKSVRQWINSDFLDEQMIADTHQDGHIDNIRLKYLDIRFGNICNLKCRMCGHGLSSTWYEEEKALAEKNGKTGPETKFIHVDCYDMVEPYFDFVEEIYFAGGEPILYPEHIKILEKLIALGRTDVKLKYNSNLTTLKYKRTDIVELWKQFKFVHIGASIDGMGDTAEYIRTKLSWEGFKTNFNYVKDHAPHVMITPSPTVGVLNVETLIEFEQFAILEGWYDSVSFGLNYIMSPDWLNLYNLPVWYREELIEKYKEHIQWCVDNGAMGYVVDKIYELINRLEQVTPQQDIDRCMNILEPTLDRWDQTAGGLDWKRQLPHIHRLVEENKKKKI